MKRAAQFQSILQKTTLQNHRREKKFSPADGSGVFEKHPWRMPGKMDLALPDDLLRVQINLLAGRILRRSR